MDCPRCHHATSVLDKRVEQSADRRRRECGNPACAYRFTTYEIKAEDLEGLRTSKHKLDQLTEHLSDLLKPAQDAGDTQPAALDVDIG